MLQFTIYSLLVNELFNAFTQPPFSMFIETVGAVY